MKYSTSVLAVVFVFACGSPEPTPMSRAEFALENGVLEIPRPSEELLKQLHSKHPGFAGFYCENGELVVASTNTGEAGDIAAEIGNELASECALTGDGDADADADGVTVAVPNVRITSARYDLSSLRYWRDALFYSFMDDEHAVSIHIDFQQNKVVLGVEPGFGDVPNTAASTLDIPTDAFVVVEQSKPEPASACLGVITGTTNLRGCFRPGVPGGAQLNVCPNGGCDGTPGGFCTFTAAAVRAGITGFVTAAHCVPRFGFMESDYIYQPQKDGLNLTNMVGFEFVDPPTFSCGLFGTGRCRLSDAAWIHPFATPDGGAGVPERGKIAKPQNNTGSILVSFNSRFTIIGTGSSIQGQMVNKVGENTGWTFAPTNATCIDTNITLCELPAPACGPTIRLICQDRASLGQNFGDSGAPVFSAGLPGNNVRLKGVLSAKDGTYSPWANVETNLGTLVVTP